VGSFHHSRRPLFDIIRGKFSLVDRYDILFFVLFFCVEHTKIVINKTLQTL